MPSQACLDSVFYALSDPTRRRILERLKGGPARVTDLARPFPISLNGVSKHLKVLEGAGLVRRTCRGREHVLALSARPIQRIQMWSARFERFWAARLDALEQQLEQEQEI